MAQEKEFVGLKTVYVTQGMLRAMVIRGALETAGIPVMLSYETLGATLGILVDGIGRVEVKVPSEWAQEAQDLLNAQPPAGEVFNLPPDAQP